MKIKIIVNPKAGKRSVQNQLELIAGRLLMNGTAQQIDVTRTEARGHATADAASLQPNQYDLVIACGGDGTINEVVNGLMKSGSQLPLAVLAAGTSNDFATALRLPTTAAPFCRMVEARNFQPVDIGCANGRYFMNAAAFGMFTEVAHGTDQKRKNNLGKLAYYLQAIREAPEQLAYSMPLKITSAEYSSSGQYHVCLIVNSMNVASFKRLMYKADISDGAFDVLLMKKKKPLQQADRIVHVIQKSGERFFQLLPVRAGAENELASSVTEALTDGHSEERPTLSLPTPIRLRERLKSEGIDLEPTFIYFQTSHVEFANEGLEPIDTDVDGELFGQLPLTVDVAARAVRLLVPPETGPIPLRLRRPI